MKICAACTQELPRDKFSKRQWDAKKYQRRCKNCVDSNCELQLKPPPQRFQEVPKQESPAIEHQPSPSSVAAVVEGGEDAIQCWICFEEGPDERGNPLRRDCSCRGKWAGYAHLPCVVKHAQQKSQRSRGLDKFLEPWRTCPNCAQGFQNELSVEMASEFIAFTEDNYPDENWMQMESLSLKSYALQSMIDCLTQEQKDEARGIGNKILRLVDEMREKDSSLPLRIIQIEAGAYNSLGGMSLMEGTEEGARTAVGYFEKCRAIKDEMNDTHGVAVAESNLALARSKYCGKDPLKELGISQKSYDQQVKNLGEGAIDTIRAGMNLSTSLKNANRFIQAERLLTKLAAVCRQVHGPDHTMTKLVKAALGKRERYVVAKNVEDQWMYFVALEYVEEGKKCRLQGPVTNPRNVEAERSYIYPTEDVRLTAGIPVFCEGLEDDLSHLNGKIGDVRSRKRETGQYKVHFDDTDIEARFFNPENLRVLFRVPDE